MTCRCAPVLTALLCAASFILSVTPVTAGEASGPARVSVAYAGVSLKDALRQFQEQSGIRLAYAEDLLAGAAPVTLKRENAPAEKVLREILRPQGLEAVLTDKNLAAIVPAWSDRGMAKAFGRALGIGLRLGNKLDGATVEGDEVRVPGWTDEDDADLALGVTDLIVSIAYFNEKRPSFRDFVGTFGGKYVPIGVDEPLAQIRALLRSADPAVRAGALMPLLEAPALVPFISGEVEQGLTDPHPAVRTASAILFAAIIEDGQWPGGKSSPADAEALLRTLAADPEAGVRMAAVVALAVNTCVGDRIDLAFDPDGEMLEAFLADRSAFVRQTARFLAMVEPGMIERKMPEGPAKTKWLALNADDGLKATLRDPNPIARAVSFAFAQIMQLHQQRRDKAAPRDRVAEIWTAAELAKDPWMKTVHGLIAPALAGHNQVALEKTIAAAGSDKPSHQATALLSLSLGYYLGRPKPQAAARRGKLPKIPDLAPLIAGLSSSKWLWGKLSGIALDAALPFAGPMSVKPLPPEALQAAEGRISAALASPDESVRLVALLAHYGRTMVGLPSQPEPILAALRSRRVPEMLLGAQCAGRCLPPDQLLEEIESLLPDATRRCAIETLLGGIWVNPSLQKLAPEAKLAFARKLAELVIARQNPTFEIALFKNDWTWLRDEARQKELAELILTKASLEAVAARYRHGTVRDTDALIIMNRLQLAAADPAKRAVVLETWAALEDHLYNLPDRENPAVVLALLDQAMAGGPANAREAAGRLRALPSIFSELSRRNQEQWGVEIKRLPPNLAKALELALASAGDPAPSTEAVALLVATVDNVYNAGGVKRGWLREAWTANHPALIQAMDGAVQKVLAGTREDDKVPVWRALARSGDKSAVEALTERILDGRVPNQTRVLALIAASKNPGLLPPGFLPALLETIRDPAGNLSRRVQLVSVLNSCPGLWGNTLSEGLERLVWDDQAAVPLRSASLRLLISVFPNGDNQQFGAKGRAVRRQAVAAYGTLPVAMIVDNLNGLTGIGEETIEEDLLVRVIEDKRLRGENGANSFQSLFQSLLRHLERSQGLDKLKAPDRLRQALDKLEKEWPAERRNEFENYMLPHGLQELRKKLEALKPLPKPEPSSDF
jgi:hypothetical protein